MMTVINLEENHRQNEDKDYADLLNRMRRKKYIDEDQRRNDIAKLKTRVRPREHPDYDDVNLYVVCTNMKAAQINNKFLSELEGEKITLKASHLHSAQAKWKPNIKETGNVAETGFVDELNLKVGCKVMLINNVDTADCQTNGQLGKLKDVIKTVKGEVKILIVEFNHEKAGRNWRSANPRLAAKYPKGTGIERVQISYKMTKSSTARNMTLVQFPIKLAYAVTAHKIQGQTIPKPMKVALDISYCRDPHQAYVMLSRVQDIRQIIIMDKLDESKIKWDSKALEEVEKMDARSLNANPTPWMKKSESTKIATLNCRSLMKNFEDILKDHFLLNCDILNLQETWLEQAECDEDLEALEGIYGLLKEGFESKFANVGRGKGIATYYRKSLFTHVEDKIEATAQVSKYQSQKVDVINVYRSEEHSSSDLAKTIINMVSPNKATIVCGDFNICYRKTPGDKLIKELEHFGMKQLNKEPSHEEGGTIDHIYYQKSSEWKEPTIERHSPYYSDHDALCITLEPEENNDYSDPRLRQIDQMRKKKPQQENK